MYSSTWLIWDEDVGRRPSLDLETIFTIPKGGLVSCSCTHPVSLFKHRSGWPCKLLFPRSTRQLLSQWSIMHQGLWCRSFRVWGWVHERTRSVFVYILYHCNLTTTFDYSVLEHHWDLSQYCISILCPHITVACCYRHWFRFSTHDTIKNRSLLDARILL